MSGYYEPRAPLSLSAVIKQPILWQIFGNTGLKELRVQSLEDGIRVPTMHYSPFSVAIMRICEHLYANAQFVLIDFRMTSLADRRVSYFDRGERITISCLSASGDVCSPSLTLFRNETPLSAHHFDIDLQ